MSAVQRAELIHQQLLRSMDALIDHQKEVDDCVASLLRPLIDDELPVVFYDLTSIRAEAPSKEDEDLRQFGIGMSREAVVACQFGICKEAVVARQFGMSSEGPGPPCAATALHALSSATRISAPATITRGAGHVTHATGTSSMW